MTDDNSSKQDGGNWKRRTVLKLAGTGAALPLVGTASANPPAWAKARGRDKERGSGNPHCPECSEGTLQVAKYEYNEETGEFEFEKGICDPVTFTEIEDKEGEENEPIRVCFETDLFFHDAIVKAGQFCEAEEIAYDPAFTEEDPHEGRETYTGCIDVSDNNRAISHITFCAGVCYQVELVAGDPIREQSEENRYGLRIVRAHYGGTADGVTGVTRKFGKGRSAYRGVTGQLTVDESTHEATARFSVDEGCKELSLVSYLAPCPEFGTETRDQQVLFDYAPEDAFEAKQEFCEGERYTLTVALPELTAENIEEFC